MDRILTAGFVALLAASCESKTNDEASENAVSAIASSNPALAGQPAASAEPAPPPDPPEPVARHPGDESELELTDTRRARLENRHPEAAGFVTQSSLEKKLFSMSLKRGKDGVAMKRLDRLAQGKWVLFAGHLVEPKPDSVGMAVRYTPRDPEDKLGITSQWVTVKLSDIEGWDAKEYETGDLTAVLAEYQGDGKASPGYDLILGREWFDRKTDDEE